MSKKGNPQISTIIPVLNGARYIARAIESILEQNHPNMEVIVVDDGSTDETKKVVGQYIPDVTYYYHEHKGIAATMNRGVNMSSGEFLCFLDSDDFWLPGKIHLQMDVMEKDTEVDMVYGHVKQFFSPELAETLKNKYTFPEHPTPGFHAGAMLIRRSSFLKIGFFNEQYIKGSYNDWYMRAVEAGLKQVMLPDLVYMRRIHDANHGILCRDASTDYVKMLKAALDRRRGQK
jgi:glycosyltransferase involved in cell wall biosynthesis